MSNLSLTYYVWDVFKQRKKKCAFFTSSGAKNGTLDSWEVFTVPISECHVWPLHCAFPLFKHPLVSGHPLRSKENAITLGWAPLSVMVLVFKYKFSHSRTEITCNSLLGQSPGVAIIPLGSAHSCCFNVSFSPPFLF